MHHACNDGAAPSVHVTCRQRGRRWGRSHADVGAVQTWSDPSVCELGCQYRAQRGRHRSLLKGKTLLIRQKKRGHWRRRGAKQAPTKRHDDAPSLSFTVKRQGVSTSCDAPSFFGLTSKTSPLGSMLNFDADVKKTTARHPMVKTASRLRTTRWRRNKTLTEMSPLSVTYSTSRPDSCSTLEWAPEANGKLRPRADETNPIPPCH